MDFDFSIDLDLKVIVDLSVIYNAWLPVYCKPVPRSEGTYIPSVNRWWNNLDVRVKTIYKKYTNLHSNDNIIYVLVCTFILLLFMM